MRVCLNCEQKRFWGGKKKKKKYKKRKKKEKEIIKQGGVSLAS